MNLVSPVTRSIAAGAVTAALLSVTAADSHAQWTVTPYLWAAGIDADVSLHGTQVVSQHIGFSDLVEDVDLAAMVRVEGQFGRVGAMVDLFYIGMSTPAQSVTLPGGGEGLVDADIDMTVVDAVAGYRLDGVVQGLSVRAGSRVLVEGSSVNLHGPSSAVTVSHSGTDWQPNGIVGLRFNRRLLSHLSVDSRSDIGTGGVELTWSADLEMVYGFGRQERFGVRLGYRALTIRYREETSVQTDMTMSGLITGFTIGF